MKKNVAVGQNWNLEIGERVIPWGVQIELLKVMSRYHTHRASITESLKVSVGDDYGSISSLSEESDDSELCALNLKLEDFR